MMLWQVFTLMVLFMWLEVYFISAEEEYAISSYHRKLLKYEIFGSKNKLKDVEVKPSKQPSVYSNAVNQTRPQIKVHAPPAQSLLDVPPPLPQPGKIKYKLFNSTLADMYEVCDEDAELTRLVHTAGTRLHIFMLYHNPRTHLVAKKFAYCKDYVTPVYLRQTKYMESIIYRDIFTAENMTRLERDFDYVLICTYRHALTTAQLRGAWVHALTPATLRHLLHVAHEKDFDAIPLEVLPQVDIPYSLMMSHSPTSVKAWNALLINMNFTQAEMRCAARIRAFWRNSYLAKPNVLNKLANLMRIGMSIVDNEKFTLLQRYFRSDARYSSGDPIVANKIFGTAYYQMHPFVFERLPSFLLAMMRAKVFVENGTHVSIALPEVREDWEPYLVRSP